MLFSLKNVLFVLKIYTWTFHDCDLTGLLYQYDGLQLLCQYSQRMGVVASECNLAVCRQ